MCGRFTLTTDPSEAGDEFEGFDFPRQFSPRYNVAPSQAILALPNDGKNLATFFIWGLIPSWAREAAIGNRLINARGETLADRPAFRGAYKYRRCLIPADGFYEWKSRPGTRNKAPHLIRLKNHKPFAFAGLWEEWHASDGSSVRSCTIITTGPNALMAPIHDRMPLILGRNDYAEWLDPAPRPPESLGHLIKAASADEMEAYVVSSLVNNPKIDQADCILPA